MQLAAAGRMAGTVVTEQPACTEVTEQPACTVVPRQPARQGSQEGLNIAESDKVDHRNQRTCKASEKDRLRMSDIYCTTYVYATTPMSVIIGHA